MQLSSQECIYIGDTHYDILTAHGVGMPCLIVTTGAQSREALLQHSPQPEAIYANLWELGESFFDLESANTNSSSVAK
jgi:phosphoglycolate phosphatase-like HAD superfamily hydrolase